MRRLAECEEQFEALLLEKKNIMKNAGSPEVDELILPDATLIRIPPRLETAENSLIIAEDAKNVIENILLLLHQAEQSAIVDSRSSRTYVGTSKYSRLDEAQAENQVLHRLLNTLHSNLGNQFIPADIRIGVSGVQRLCDRYLDNIFSDRAVLDTIRSSIAQATKLRDEVISIIFKLDALCKDLVAEYEAAKDKVEEIVMNCKL